MARAQKRTIGRTTRASAGDLTNKKCRLDKPADVVKTTNISARLQGCGGAEEARGQLQAASRIPAGLAGSIEVIGPRVYRLAFAIKDLRTFQRECWAVRPEATSVVVNVNMTPGSRSFCVHQPPDDERWPSWHQMCLVSEPWPNNLCCNSYVNFLSHCLGCDLYDMLSQTDPSLKDIHDTVLGILESDPRQHCIVCTKPFGLEIKVWRPTACSKCEAILNGWPLEVRLSPLLAHSSVLDFLLCCCMSEARDADPGTFRGVNRREGCPIPLDKIPAVLNSFPKLSDWMDPEHLVTGKHGSDRRDFLSWLCRHFQACIVPAPVANQVACTDAGTAQFLLLNACLKRQSGFADRRRHLGRTCGEVRFHGSPSVHLMSILADGLRRPTEDANGWLGADTTGVFHADEPAYSMEYVQGTRLFAWTGSRWRDRMVLFGLEVLSHTVHFVPGESYTVNEKDVMIRYIFLIPSTNMNTTDNGFLWGGNCKPTQTVPARKAIASTMAATFQDISSDTITGRLGLIKPED